MRYLAAVTAVGAVLVWEDVARRRAKARADRLHRSGHVDLEPFVAASEELTAAIRLSGRPRCHRSAHVGAIRAVP